MIQEDAINFQAQLKHLFRVFEVDVAVGLHSKDGDYGCTLLSSDPQLVAHDTILPAKKAKKKDPLSG